MPAPIPVLTSLASRRGRRGKKLVEDYVGKSRESVRRVIRELDVELARIRGWLETEEDEATHAGPTRRVTDPEEERRKLDTTVGR